MARIPENKRYSHVRSSLDTGASAKKRSVISTSAVLRRRGEIFRRIRPATLVQLLEERNVHESVFAMGSDNGDAHSVSSTIASRAGVAPSTGAASRFGAVPTTAAASRVGAHRPAASLRASSASRGSVLHRTGNIIMTQKSSKASISGISNAGSVAGSVVSIIDTDTTVDESRDLVVLDLREPSEFETCRLPLAVNYPASRISRDQFSQDLYQCKKDPNKLLVVYHKDDQTSAFAATTLVHKGWDSVYVLSGGFDEIAQSYPEVMQGEVPDGLGNDYGNVCSLKL